MPFYFFTAFLVSVFLVGGAFLAVTSLTTLFLLLYFFANFRFFKNGLYIPFNDGFKYLFGFLIPFLWSFLWSLCDVWFFDFAIFQ
jgi:hypothetical protein